MATRICTILAACLLVGAFALAALAAPDLALGHALVELDHGVFPGLQNAAGVLPGWFWPHVMEPVLARPVWFLPTALGLILGGCAVSLRSRQSGQPRQRRS